MKIDNLIAGTIEDEFGETCPSRLVTQIIRICSERALEAVEIDKEKVGKIMSDFECDINEGVGLQEVLYREKPIKLKEEE